MNRVLLVGVGGFMGSVLRFGIGSWVGRTKNGLAFPLETLVVNLAGCLAIGLLAGIAEARGAFAPATRALMFTGLLGGFTTFSAFGYETFDLLRVGRWMPAALSIGAQVVLGIGAVWAGHAMARS